MKTLHWERHSGCSDKASDKPSRDQLVSNDLTKVQAALALIFEEHARLISQNKTLLSYINFDDPQPPVPSERIWDHAPISQSDVLIDPKSAVFIDEEHHSMQEDSASLEDILMRDAPSIPTHRQEQSAGAPSFHWRHSRDSRQSASQDSSTPRNDSLRLSHTLNVNGHGNNKLYDRIQQSVRANSRMDVSGSLFQYQLMKGWISMPKHLMSSIAGHTNSSIDQIPILRRITKSNWFDMICAVAIVANSIMLAVATDHAAKNRITDQFDMPSIYTALDYAFCLWFTLELTMRALSDGPRTYWSCRRNKMWAWNYFDTVVVVMNIFESAVQLMGFSLGGGNLTAFRMLRVLRVARALRVLRLVHLFKELRMMALCILKSYVTLLWSMVLLVITMFIFGTLLTQNVTVALHLDKDPILTKQDVQALEKYYGDLPRTMYTLFVSVTGGIDWDNANAVLYKTGWVNGMIFCFYIFFTVLALLNIISGIFLDSAMTAAHTDKDEVIQAQLREERSAIQQIRELFQELTDGVKEELSAEDFEKHLNDDRVQAHLASLGLAAGEVHGLFKLLDLDDSGTVSVEEFLFGCMRMKGTAKALDVATLMYENKRMGEKWSKFMIYVKEQFRERRMFERRMGEKLAEKFPFVCS